MHKNLAAISGLAALCLAAQHSSAGAASLSPEDRYVAARDAAIAKISKLYDAKSDDAAQKAEDAMRADLLAQMKAIVGDTGRKGYGPVKLSLLSFYKGDEDLARWTACVSIQSSATTARKRAAMAPTASMSSREPTSS